MRAYSKISPETQVEILKRFLGQEISYKGIESTYNVSCESFADFYQNEFVDRWNIEFPKPIEETKLADKIVDFIQIPFVGLFFNIVFSIGFYLLFNKLPYWLKDSIDPLQNTYLSTFFGASAVFTLVISIVKFVMIFTDTENFKYLTNGINSSFDYTKDINNGLTSFQRLCLHLAKYLFYLLAFVLIYFAMLRALAI